MNNKFEETTHFHDHQYGTVRASHPPGDDEMNQQAHALLLLLLRVSSSPGYGSKHLEVTEEVSVLEQGGALHLGPGAPGRKCLPRRPGVPRPRSQLPKRVKVRQPLAQKLYVYGLDEDPLKPSLLVYVQVARRRVARGDHHELRPRLPSARLVLPELHRT